MALLGIFGTATLLAFCLVYNAGCVEGSADIMKQISKAYGSAMEECKKELNINDDILKEMMNFWNHDYNLVSRELGCAIICMSKKHDLLADGKLHHDNAAEFAKKHGADDAMAKKLVEIIHGCENENAGNGTDECVIVLEVAKCFRTKVKELDWAPNFQDLMEEMMAEASG